MKTIFIGLRQICSTVLIILFFNSVKAQSSYFPPVTGSAWDTLSPSALGWCQPDIDSLYNFLQTRNTNAFIVLKDGKIVLEKYFGSFNSNSIHYWASAGKSLTSMLVGIAQENNLININDPVSNYLGTGWTSEPVVKENLITVKNLISMTSGLDDAPSSPCTNEDTSTTCLQYFADAGTRWAYHTGAYKRVQDVISSSSGLSYNTFTDNYLGSHIGLTGSWVNGVFYSVPRGAARFGLLALNKGVWGADTVLGDTAYFNQMINTSQNYNLSYGYLWWLNGKSSYMAPGLQTVFTSDFMSNAPADMFCALGKNDQKIYVIPSMNMVVVRIGSSAYGISAAFSPFDNELWGYLNNLYCTTGLNQLPQKQDVTVFPNPFSDKFGLRNTNGEEYYRVMNVIGEILWSGKNIEQKDFSNLSKGIYLLSVSCENSVKVIRLIKE